MEFVIKSVFIIMGKAIENGISRTNTIREPLRKKGERDEIDKILEENESYGDYLKRNKNKKVEKYKESELNWNNLF